MRAALLIGMAAGLVVLLGPLGLARAARRAGLTHPRLWAGLVLVGLVGWLGVTAGFAVGVRLDAGPSQPPRWPLLPLTALVTLIVLNRTRGFGRLLAAVPPWQPIALQVFRVGVELAFWRLHTTGLAPVQITFEGQNFDGLVGLTAPLLAWGVATGRVGPRGWIAWNLAGLALLINAMATVATSAPGPLHLAWPGPPFQAIATWPVIWVPAFLAPTGIFLHVVSLRQAFRAWSA